MKKTFFLSCTLLLLLIPSLYAKDRIYSKPVAVRLIRCNNSDTCITNKYRANIQHHWIKCYDGDTCNFDIPSFHPFSFLGKDIPIRLRGVDTPEIHGKCANGKKYKKKLAKDAKRFVITQIQNAKTIELRNLSRGKYRIVADIYVDNKNLSDQLLDHKLAYRYYGGTKKKIFGVSNPLFHTTS